MFFLHVFFTKYNALRYENCNNYDYSLTLRPEITLIFMLPKLKTAAKQPFTANIIRVLLFLFVSLSNLDAQVYVQINEDDLIETKWRYTYTMHLETNTIIHQSEDTYQHFLYFRYDSTYEQYLNGSLTEGNWSLKGNNLKYPFRRVKQFSITTLTEMSLDMEFTQPNSKGTYMYHFVRVESKEAPFLRHETDLPEITIEAKATKPLKNDLAKTSVKEKKSKNKTYISIELVGGGYYGGLDPVIRDYIIIKNDGRLIKEFKSINAGLVVTKKNISRHELEQFAEWTMTQNFFSFQRQYDCNTSFCEKRMNVKPRPVPLRLSVTYGNVRKMVTVSIWGKDKTGASFVDYPPELDNIIDAIQRMASRV
jgi:hypothetical protein